MNGFFRVKEIAVGIMANMLCHEKVFLGIVEKQRYTGHLIVAKQATAMIFQVPGKTAQTARC